MIGDGSSSWICYWYARKILPPARRGQEAVEGVGVDGRQPGHEGLHARLRAGGGRRGGGRRGGRRAHIEGDLTPSKLPRHSILVDYK